MGNDIKDVNGIIAVHLYLDYAGSSENFIDSDILTDVHGEFKHACWVVATGADQGIYLGCYVFGEAQVENIL